MRRFRVVFVLLLIVAAGLGAAAAAGAFTGPSATGQVDSDTMPAVRTVPQDNPNSALMRRVLIGGEPGAITPAPHQTSPVGSAAARRLALDATPAHGHGIRVLGAGLAYDLLSVVNHVLAPEQLSLWISGTAGPSADPPANQPIL